MASSSSSSSSSSVARPLPQPMVLATVILLLSSISVLAAEEPPRASARPPAVAAGRSPQDFLVATAPLPDAGVAKKGPERRPIGGARMRGRRTRPDRGRGRGGGTGAWAFSAMLPRVRVPPSGSSACHNSMPAAAYAQFYACGGSASP